MQPHHCHRFRKHNKVAGHLKTGLARTVAATILREKTVEQFRSFDRQRTYDQIAAKTQGTNEVSFGDRFAEDL
jgi:hypothetical protein